MKKNIMIEHVSYEELVRKIDELFQLYTSSKNAESKTEFELLTREETAKLLKVSFGTLNKWSKKKILVPSHIGKRVYYCKSNILDVIERSQFIKTAKR